MSTLPTAKEFLDLSSAFMDNHDIEETMIMFAKIHVRAALKTAAKEAVTEEVWGDCYVDKNSILNSYPLTNIK